MYGKLDKLKGQGHTVNWMLFLATSVGQASMQPAWQNSPIFPFPDKSGDYEACLAAAADAVSLPGWLHLCQRGTHSVLRSWLQLLTWLIWLRLPQGSGKEKNTFHETFIWHITQIHSICFTVSGPMELVEQVLFISTVRLWVKSSPMSAPEAYGHRECRGLLVFHSFLFLCISCFKGQSMSLVKGSKKKEKRENF